MAFSLILTFLFCGRPWCCCRLTRFFCRPCHWNRICCCKRHCWCCCLLLLASLLSLVSLSELASYFSCCCRCPYFVLASFLLLTSLQFPASLHAWRVWCCWCLAFADAPAVADVPTQDYPCQWWSPAVVSVPEFAVPGNLVTALAFAAVSFLAIAQKCCKIFKLKTVHLN